MAEILGGAQDFPRARQHSEAQAVHTGYVPLPFRRRSSRGPPGRLHGYRHVLPLPADARLQRAPSDGLRRLWLARGAVCDRDRHAPAENHRAEYRQHPPSDQAAGIQLRLGARVCNTDTEYMRWTQWIFLVLYDTWYDPDLEWSRLD